MADALVARPGFRDLQVRYVDMLDTTWAEKIAVVNPDGTPIAGGSGGYVTKATAAPPVYVEGTIVPLSVDLGGVLRTTAGGGGGAVDVTDRAGRLLGVTYGSQGQQLKQTATNFNLQAELAVGGTLIDPRSIRTLTSADVVDVSDRVGRALGVVASITAAVDVSDRAGRLVGVVTAANLDVALSTRLKPADTLTAVTTVTSLTQMNGQAIAMGTGVRSAGTQRVTIATDDVVPVTGTFFQGTQPVSIAAAVDVSDRAARLVGVVYGSQAQQAKQTATNFNAQVEVAVGGTLIDPRSIRTLTSADVVDVFDKAAREVGRIRIWDGTDEATVIPVRTQPAATEKALMVAEIPIRIATYSTTTITVAPAITIGVKEMLAIWHVVGSTKDKFIVEIWASGIVTTASTTGGRTAVRVSTITTAPTGGTEEAKVDVSGAGASDMTNTMRVKTGGGAIGSTFIRKLAWHATQAIGSTFREPLFQASNPGNGIILRAGVAAGISIDVEREVAHTALVDSWTVGIRWLEV